MADKTVVLVHGAWHGAWCWEKVTPLLDEAGVAWKAVDMPMQSLDGDIAAVRDALDDVAGPAVLVGHSYGGVVISGAGSHPLAEHLLFVAAFAVTEQESASAAMPDVPVSPSELGKGFRIDDAGQVTLDHDVAIRCLYNRCDPADAEAAYDRLRPISISCFTAWPGVAAWRTTPSTYLLCLDDQGVPAELQRLMGERAGATVVEWDTDHSPFLAEPARTAELLVSLARA